MSLYNRQATSQMTDEICANRLARQLTQAVGMARVCLRRTSANVNSSPGGKAAIVAALGADGQEIVDILVKLEALVNAHKNDDDADVVASLTQADLV